MAGLDCSGHLGSLSLDDPVILTRRSNFLQLHLNQCTPVHVADRIWSCIDQHHLQDPNVIRNWPIWIRSRRVKYSSHEEYRSGYFLGLPSKFRSEKIPRNRLGTVFVIPRNKVLIPCDSEYFRRVHFVTRNETEWNSAKYWSLTKQLPKVVFFPSFSLPKMIRNGIPKFFSVPKMIGNSKIFNIQKWFRMEFRGVFSSEK